MPTTERKRDIFDRLAEKMEKGTVLTPRKKDIFDRIKLSDAELELIKLKKEIPTMIEQAIREAVSKIKVPEAVKETIREVRIEGPKPKEYDGQISELKKVIEDQKKELGKLKDQVEFTPFPGGPGVIGIPTPEGKSNRVLTVVNNVPTWSAPTTQYFGDPSTNGSWRIVNDGTNLSFQRLESGTWTEKSAVLA